MAVGALIPLILGGGFALQERERARTEQERANLARGFSSAIGTQGSPGAGPGLFNDQMLGEGAVQGTGLLGQTTDPRIQQQMIAAGNLFGMKGGEDIGQSMLANALAMQQQNAGQENLFNQQDASQLRGFGNTNEQNRLRLEQDQQQAAATLKDRQDARAAEIQRSSDLFQRQNSVAGIPDGDKVRVQIPGGGPGDFVDVPKQGTPAFIKAQAQLNQGAAQVTRLDNLMTLFKETGSLEFGRQSGELDALFNATMVGFKEIFDLGVLSGDDMDLIQGVIPDPQSLGSLGSSNAKILGQYGEGMRILQSRLRDKNQEYALWGLGSELDKTTPSQIKAQQNRIAQEEAALTGSLSGGEIIPGRAPTGGGPSAAGRGRGDINRLNF